MITSLNRDIFESFRDIFDRIGTFSEDLGTLGEIPGHFGTFSTGHGRNLRDVRLEKWTLLSGRCLNFRDVGFWFGT